MNECLSQNITGGADYEKASNDFESINEYVVDHYTDYSLAPFNDSTDIKGFVLAARMTICSQDVQNKINDALNQIENGSVK